MKKLTAKYTIEQGTDLSHFMKSQRGIRVGMFYGKPSIIISDEDRIDNFRDLDETANDIYYNLYTDRPFDSVLSLDEILNYIFEHHNLILYNSLRIRKLSDINDDEQESQIRLPIKSEFDEEYVLYSHNIKILRRKRKNNGKIKR